MGHALYYYFVKAGSVGGSPARTRLSFLTDISSIEASFLPDTQESITKFDSAFEKIKFEFKDDNKPQNTSSKWTETKTLDKLRSFISLQTDILSQRHLFENDKELVYKRFTEILIKGIQVDRASIWMYNGAKTSIVCQDLFIKEPGIHEKSTEIQEHLFPQYFKALKKEKTIAAVDARTDIRTRELADGYMKPLRIISMLDVPIWMNQQLVGVICNECTTVREWNSDEEDFVYLMSNSLAFFLESFQNQ